MRLKDRDRDVSLEARNSLVEGHIGLVKVLAARLARRVPAKVEVSELVSAGIVGLLDAARRYQPSLGVPFDAFARRRVHGAMLDSLRGLDWAPRSLRRHRRDLDAAIARLRHAYQREATEQEIAAELKMSEAEYQRVLEQVRTLDLGIVRESPSRSTPMVDLAIDPEDNPYERIERAELGEHLARAILELPERERRVLALYYEHDLTLAEIGAVLGVGESRVCQLRTQATSRLRSRLRETLQISEPR